MRTARPITVSLPTDLLRLAKIAAVRTGKKEYQVVEEALRGYLGIEAVTRAWKSSELSEDEALALAYNELHASRERVLLSGKAEVPQVRQRGRCGGLR